MYLRDSISDKEQARKKVGEPPRRAMDSMEQRTAVSGFAVPLSLEHAVPMEELNNQLRCAYACACVLGCLCSSVEMGGENGNKPKRGEKQEVVVSYAMPPVTHNHDASCDPPRCHAQPTQ